MREKKSETEWWIVTIFWQGEGAKNPLPAEYLKKE